MELHKFSTFPYINETTFWTFYHCSLMTFQIRGWPLQCAQAMSHLRPRKWNLSRVAGLFLSFNIILDFGHPSQSFFFKDWPAARLFHLFLLTAIKTFLEAPVMDWTCTPDIYIHIFYRWFLVLHINFIIFLYHVLLPFFLFLVGSLIDVAST